MSTSKTTVNDCFEHLEKIHWDLMSNLKTYFCLRFENHEVLDEFMELCIENPSQYIAVLIKRFLAPIGECENIEIPEELSHFLNSDYQNKKPTKKLIKSRETLLISTLLAVRGYKAMYKDKQDFSSALRDICAAENFFGFFMGGSDLIFGEGSVIALASAGGQAKKAKDPKQIAKQQVRECWDIWKSDPSRYKSKSAFSRDMLGKYEQLESSEVIQRWCREWESELYRQS